LTEEGKAACSTPCTSDYESHRPRNSNPKPVPGTRAWFLQHEKHKPWQQRRSPGLLWVSADPGRGKSVLVSFLIDANGCAERVGAAQICYFVFKDDGEEQRTADLALQALLHQIRTKQPGLLTHLTAYHASRGSSVAKQFHSSWNLFKDTHCERSGFERHDLHDALDECDKASWKESTTALAEDFKDEQKQERGSPALKMLITSRPGNAIKNTFSKVGNIRLRGGELRAATRAPSWSLGRACQGRGSHISVDCIGDYPSERCI